MSGYLQGNRGLSGNRLLIVLAAWLVLVIVGGLCTWYGWFGSADQGGRSEARATPTAGLAEVLTVTPMAAAESAGEPVEPTMPATPSQPPTTGAVEEEFGYGIAIHGTGGGDVGYMMGQVESLGMGWIKQQMRWTDVERTEGQMEWGNYDWVVDEANKRGIKVMFSVVDAPSWKRSDYVDDNPEGAPPANLADFAWTTTRRALRRRTWRTLLNSWVWLSIATKAAFTRLRCGMSRTWIASGTRPRG